jgi:PAS domain S-box-containing protein
MTTSAADRRVSGLETRWRQVLEATREPYLALDGEGRVVDANRAAGVLLGAGDLLGRTVADLVVEGDRARLLASLDRLVAEPHDGEPWEVCLLTALGEVHGELAVWGVDRRGGTRVHCFLRDVSARHEAQRNAALLAAVVEGSADAVVTEAPDRRILTWNPAAERIYGWTAEEAIGASGLLIVPPDKVREHAQLVDDVLDGVPVRGVESERVSRGGTLVPVSLRMSPVRDVGGDIVAVSTIARDITEQRWMAETLDATLQQLTSALEEATASEQSARRFLADAAHQLRTPLTGIRACAELLLLGSPKTDQDKLLATMVRETSRAGRLITALLRIARLDQGEPLPVGAVDVVALCRDEVERLCVLAPHLDVTLDLQSGPELTVPVDSSSCQEILGNLGDNAVRHARRSVVVCVDVQAEQVRIGVSDDGPGIDASNRERVFERFVSLDGRGGSGLGLPIARGLARAMGGDLRYEDGFVLTLPVASS